MDIHICRALFIFSIIVLVSESTSLKIKELKVPELIKYGDKKEIVLDCDYDIGMNAEEEGLVVKWFYEDTQQIYQWIPKNRPQEIGRLKGKLDLNYKASDEPNKMYRALNIKNIDPQLTGNYTCVVSTFADEVRESKRMVIYDPEDEFELTFDNVDEDTLKVTCSASNIYPKPDIVIHARKPNLKSEVENLTLEENHWQISTSMLIDVDAGPETIKCELRIPDANYSKMKEAYYSSAILEKACTFLLLVSPLISTSFLQLLLN